MSTEYDVEMKKPELGHFGITPKEYALYTGKEDEGLLILLLFPLCSVVVLVIVSIVWVVTHDWQAALGWGVLAILTPLGWLVIGGVSVGFSKLIEPTIRRYRRYKRDLFLISPAAPRIKQYEQAEAAYQTAKAEAERQRREAERQREEAEKRQREAERQRAEAKRRQQRRREQYWMSLGGIEFERELASLSRAMGYRVESTPVSGDQGIDLILRRGGKTTVVQCKAHKSPAGPSVARELFGSMVHYGADDAILACTGGFTKGVEEFVQGKPIRLISAPHLVRLAEQYGNKTQEITESPPTCPGQECGRPMVLRTGRYGSFWGCSAYPGCRGTRPV